MEILHLLGSVVTRCFFPKYTWDDIEECLIWCVERGLDPRPVKRMAKSFERRAKDLKKLLVALHVRSSPEMFCCWPDGAPHVVALHLGELLRSKEKWWAEVNCEDPALYLRDCREKLPVAPLDYYSLTSYIPADGVRVEMRYRRMVGDDFHDWYDLGNYGVKQEYFELWRHLNMLYERLSLPWEPLKYPNIDCWMIDAWKIVKDAIADDFNFAKNEWNALKRLISEADSDEYAHERESKHLKLGRLPDMELDFSLEDGYVHEICELKGKDWKDFLENRPPRKRYRRNCTPKELVVLDRECRIDGTPWK